jgi:copper(I)-binding protein
MRSILFGLTLLLMSTPVVLAAEIFRVGTIEIEKPWSRASIGKMRPAAAYFTIRNTGTQADRLIGVKTPAARMAEIHETTLKEGVMSMAPVGHLNLPPGKTIILKPGGLHVMMMKLHSPLEKGENIILELTFKNAGKTQISAPVLSAGASGL